MFCNFPVNAWVIIYKYTRSLKDLSNFPCVEKSSKKASLTIEHQKRVELLKTAFLNVEKNEGFFKAIKEEFHTYETCLLAVKRFYFNIYYIEQDMLTFEIVLEAVKQDGACLQCVPDELKTLEICLTAVNRNGMALKSVNNSQEKYHKICLSAVRQNGRALQLVDKNVLNSKKYSNIQILAVKQDPATLQFISEEDQTREICLTAVTQDGRALEWVKKQTEEICVASIQQDKGSIRFVQPKFQSACLYYAKKRKWRIQECFNTNGVFLYYSFYK